MASPDLSVVALSAGLALVLTTVLWGLTSYAITMAHEGGHAVSTVLVGSQVAGVTIDRGPTGETGSHPIHVTDHTWVLMTGYVGPSAFGFAGAVVLAHGRPDAVLWTSVVLLALLLTTARNVLAAVTMIATALVLLVVARRGSEGTQAVVACTWVWFLLFGGIRHIVARGPNGADHQVLQERTLIPRVVWFLLFLLGSLAALAAGGAILVGAVAPPF